MKEQKPLRPGIGDPSPSQPNSTGEKDATGDTAESPPLQTVPAGQTPLRPGLMMDMDAQIRKQGGKMTREAMIRLGTTLRAYFDDVRKEGVPDRFKDLLEQYDKRVGGEDQGKGSN